MWEGKVRTKKIKGRRNGKEWEWARERTSKGKKTEWKEREVRKRAGTG